MSVQGFPRIVFPVYPGIDVDIEAINRQGMITIFGSPNFHQWYPQRVAQFTTKKFAYISFPGIITSDISTEQSFRSAIRTAAMAEGLHLWEGGATHGWATEWMINPVNRGRWAALHVEQLRPLLAAYDGVFIDNFFETISWVTQNPADDPEWMYMRRVFLRLLRREWPELPIVVNGSPIQVTEKLDGRMIEGVPMPGNAYWFKGLFGMSGGVLPSPHGQGVLVQPRERWRGGQPPMVILAAKPGYEHEAMAMSLLFDGWMAPQTPYPTIPNLYPGDVRNPNLLWFPLGDAELSWETNRIVCRREFATRLGQVGWCSVWIVPGMGWRVTECALPWDAQKAGA